MINPGPRHARRYRPSKPTEEEARQLAEAQAILRERNAQVIREYGTQKQIEREARREAARQQREETKAKEKAWREEVARQRRALRDAERALHPGKGLTMRLTQEQAKQLEELSCAHAMSQSEVIRRLLAHAYEHLNRGLAK